MVSLTHLPNLDFFSFNEVYQTQIQQCHTEFLKDGIGISAVSVRNLLKFHILHNAANNYHLLTLKHDLCTVHAHLKLTCTGNFSAVLERNLLKLQTLLTADNINHMQASKHDLRNICAHLKLTRQPRLSISQLSNMFYALCMHAYVHRQYISRIY